MSGLGATDKLIALRIAALLLAAISIRSVLIQAGLTLRLCRALVTGRTMWPGPTILHHKSRPRIYPRYLANMGMVVLASTGFVLTAFSILSPGVDQIAPFVLTLVVMTFVLFVASRRVSRYDAAVEWAIGRSPEVPLSDNEAEVDVARSYVAVRAAIRRIWTQLFLIGFAALLIWFMFLGREYTRAREAMAYPEAGPLMRKHAVEAVHGTRAFYFPDSGGTISALETSRVSPGRSLAIHTANDGERLLALLLKGTVEQWQRKEVIPSILVAPSFTILFPDMDGARSRLLVVVGDPQELATFAKGRRTEATVLTVLYIGFSIYALYIVASLRRQVRVTFARKGKLKR